MFKMQNFVNSFTQREREKHFFFFAENLMLFSPRNSKLDPNLGNLQFYQWVFDQRGKFDLSKTNSIRRYGNLIISSPIDLRSSLRLNSLKCRIWSNFPRFTSILEIDHLGIKYCFFLKFEDSKSDWPWICTGLGGIRGRIWNRGLVEKKLEFLASILA